MKPIIFLYSGSKLHLKRLKTIIYTFIMYVSKRRYWQDLMTAKNGLLLLN